MLEEDVADIEQHIHDYWNEPFALIMQMHGNLSRKEERVRVPDISDTDLIAAAVEYRGNYKVLTIQERFLDPSSKSAIRDLGDRALLQEWVENEKNVARVSQLNHFAHILNTSLDACEIKQAINGMWESIYRGTNGRLPFDDNAEAAPTIPLPHDGSGKKNPALES